MDKATKPILVRTSTRHLHASPQVRPRRAGPPGPGPGGARAKIKRWYYYYYYYYYHHYYHYYYYYWYSWDRGDAILCVYACMCACVQACKRRICAWKGTSGSHLSQKEEVLLRGVGTLRYFLILGENSACQVPTCAVAA